MYFMNIVFKDELKLSRKRRELRKKITTDGWESMEKDTKPWKHMAYLGEL